MLINIFWKSEEIFEHVFCYSSRQEEFSPLIIHEHAYVVDTHKNHFTKELEIRLEMHAKIHR